MLMILGASFLGVAAWLVLADAGVRPHDNNWSMGVHVVAAWLTLQGLAAPLGEFAFGVPQFQQIFHPLLLCIAAGFAFVAMRLVLGRWWGLGIAVGNFGMNAVGLGDGAGRSRAPSGSSSSLRSSSSWSASPPAPPTASASPRSPASASLRSVCWESGGGTRAPTSRGARLCCPMPPSSA